MLRGLDFSPVDLLIKSSANSLEFVLQEIAKLKRTGKECSHSKGWLEASLFGNCFVLQAVLDIQRI